jgi:gentisate 1,2-dioxygenase
MTTEATTTAGIGPATGAEAFDEVLRRHHLVALWSVNKALLPKAPRGRCVPHLWRWETMRQLVRQAGEVAPLSRAAERRVLGFINPGLPDRFGATHTLWAGFQYLLPGEVAPAHRHSPAAIRFVIEGEGAFTTVDGDKCLMGRGDLVLTPPWTWHDHGNESPEPVLWLDGLDLPLVAELEGQFYEPFAAEAQPIGKPVGDSEGRYGVGQLRPTSETRVGPFSPLLHYRWARTEEALRRLASVVAEGESPFDDVAMEYVNPRTGGALMPTLACWIQLLRAGVRTRAHRHTGSAVYLVVAGHGRSVIDGQRFDWGPGDLFAVPTWAWHEHASRDGEAILFSVQDTPVLQALGLLREEAYPHDAGHQPVTRVFEG